MTDFVTGTPSVVGFTNGYGSEGRFNHGISDKDQMFAASIDANERTRDVIANVYNSIVATEKTGAASILATEKIGAANTLAVQLGIKDVLLEMEKCCCEIKKDVADVKATVLSVDANRIRDDLAETRAELLALRLHGTATTRS